MSFLAIFFVVALNSCEDDKDDVKEMKPETARVEFRNATQEINVDLDKMMNTVSMQSMSYLSDLLDADWEKKLKVSLFQSGKVHLAKVRDNFRPDTSGTMVFILLISFITNFSSQKPVQHC
jgi:hypothetical protein